MRSAHGEFFLRVAPAFRRLVDAFRGDELFKGHDRQGNGSVAGKFVAVEHRDQPTGRVRYPNRALYRRFFGSPICLTESAVTAA